MIPFVGPSYNLPELGVDCQRSINMHLLPVETPNDKAPARFILVSMPGRKAWMSGIGAPVRAEFSTAAGPGQRAFAVVGDTLYEVFANQTRISRGTLLTSTGPVSLDYGNTQLVLVDGDNGYVLALGSNTFTRITAPGWRGSATVSFLNNYFVFFDPGTGVYYWSQIDDATDLDALDFATAESQPDQLVAVIRDNEELRLLGASSCEMATPSATTVFAKRQGASVDVGCMATHSARNIDNGTILLGGDKNGGGIVYLIRGYQPERVSTIPVETMLKASTDLSSATSYTWQINGLTFWALNAPGLETTIVFEVSTGSWFEIADIDSYGQFIPSPVTCHMYAFGKHLVGDSAGNISEWDGQTYQNLGAPLVRERISPHYVSPGLGWNSPAAFVLDCKTGAAPIGVTPWVEMNYTKDSGATWSNPRLKTMGATGVRPPRLVWRNIGRFQDRVWKLRCSANAPFTITNVFVGDPDQR